MSKPEIGLISVLFLGTLAISPSIVSAGDWLGMRFDGAKFDAEANGHGPMLSVHAFTQSSSASFGLSCDADLASLRLPAAQDCMVNFRPDALGESCRAWSGRLSVLLEEYETPRSRYGTRRLTGRFEGKLPACRSCGSTTDQPVEITDGRFSVSIPFSGSKPSGVGMVSPTLFDFEACPSHATLTGQAKVVDGVLELTRAGENGDGSIVLHPFEAIDSPTEGLSLALRVLIGDGGSERAFGIAYGGSDDPASDRTALDSGLVLRFETLGKGNAGKGRIRARYRGVQIAGSGLRTLRTADFVKLVVAITPQGELSVIHENGEDTLFALRRIRIPNWHPPSNPRLELMASATNGGVTRVDDLDASGVAGGTCGDGLPSSGEQCDRGAANGCDGTCCTTKCDVRLGRHPLRPEHQVERGVDDSPSCPMRPAAGADLLTGVQTVGLAGLCVINEQARRINPVGSWLRLSLEDDSGRAIFNADIPGEEFDQARGSGWTTRSTIEFLAWYKSAEPAQGLKKLKLATRFATSSMRFSARIDRAALVDWLGHGPIGGRLSFGSETLSECCVVLSRDDETE